MIAYADPKTDRRRPDAGSRVGERDQSAEHAVPGKRQPQRQPAWHDRRDDRPGNTVQLMLRDGEPLEGPLLGAIELADQIDGSDGS